MGGWEGLAGKSVKACFAGGQNRRCWRKELGFLHAHRRRETTSRPVLANAPRLAKEQTSIFASA